MKAAPGLHVEWVEEEAVVLDPETGHLHYLNPSAAYIYASIQEYGYDETMNRIVGTYAPDAPLRRELPALLEEMLNKGLLLDA